MMYAGAGDAKRRYRRQRGAHYTMLAALQAPIAPVTKRCEAGFNWAVQGVLAGRFMAFWQVVHNSARIGRH